MRLYEQLPASERHEPGVGPSSCELHYPVSIRSNRRRSRRATSCIQGPTL